MLKWKSKWLWDIKSIDVKLCRIYLDWCKSRMKQQWFFLLYWIIKDQSHWYDDWLSIEGYYHSIKGPLPSTVFHFWSSLNQCKQYPYWYTKLCSNKKLLYLVGNVLGMTLGEHRIVPSLVTLLRVLWRKLNAKSSRLNLESSHYLERGYGDRGHDSYW